MAGLDNQRPGDLLLNRFFPEADHETREQAREAFRAHGLALLRLGHRIEQAQAAADSQNLDRRPIISPPPL
jgi:hypothetical protein